MAALKITREDVILGSNKLPSFPRFVVDILTELDDPDGSLTVLAGCVIRDPVITARVLSVANQASTNSRRMSAVNDIYTAISLIGMSQVRQITLVSCLGSFVGGVAVQGLPSTYWKHCLAVGVSCEELAQYVAAPISTDAALVAGLLHDVGQLWFYTFYADLYRQCWQQALNQAVSIEVVERAYFGVDHSTVGAWLAEHWSLPIGIIAAIRGHHVPDATGSNLLVPLVHLAEVLCNALDLGGREENRVTYVSTAACQQLDLLWDERIRPLFGRIEARSQHANAFFMTDAPA